MTIGTKRTDDRSPVSLVEVGKHHNNGDNWSTGVLEYYRSESWLALSHGSEVKSTIGMRRSVTKNVAMSAAHETPNVGAVGRNGCAWFGGFDCFGHSAHQLRRESRWCVRGWCCHLDGSTSQAAHHTSAVSWGKKKAPVCPLQFGWSPQWRQSGRNGSKRQPLLHYYLGGGRASCTRSLKESPKQEKKSRHRAAHRFLVCRTRTKTKIFLTGLPSVFRIHELSCALMV